MVKITRHVSLDREVYDMATQVFPNVSGTLNEILKAMLIDKKPEARELFDIMQMNMKLKEEQQKLNKEIDMLKKEAEKIKEKDKIEYV